MELDIAGQTGCRAVASVTHVVETRPPCQTWSRREESPRLTQRPSMLVLDSDRAARLHFDYLVGGWRVVQATSVAGAIEVIRNRPVDLAFVEFELQDGYGTSVLRELSERQPNAVRVLMSRNSAVPRVADASLAHLFLIKPFDPGIAQSIARAGAQGAISLRY